MSAGKNKDNLITMIKFASVGLLNTGIDYGVFLVLSALGLWYIPAHVCSYSAGLVNSFFWNKFWTFRQERVFSFSEILRFILVNLTALGLAGLVLFLGVNSIGLSEALSKAVALPFSLGVNFLGNKFLVFIRPQRAGEKGSD